MRILLLNNLPAPYFTPLFNRLAEKLEGELTVCYSSGWNQTAGWADGTEKAAVESGPGQTIILDQRAPVLRRWLGSGWAAAIALKRLLKADPHDYIICYGYTLLPQLFLLARAIATRTPYALIGDANFYNDSPQGLKGMGRTAWLRFVTGRASALIAVGSASRMFWQKYGARPDQLFTAGFAVDNEALAKSAEARKSEAAELRKRLGFENKTIFLFVGRLIERKNPSLIIEASRRLNPDHFAVVIAGSGQQMNELQAMAANQSNVHFAGNVTQSNLPLFYSLADALILPARLEPWGLVINEAMSCGLAIIAHQHCGAAVDLVDAGNGVKLNSFSVDELAKAMGLMINDQDLLRQMQKASRRKIQNRTIESAANGIVEAVNSR